MRTRLFDLLGIVAVLAMVASLWLLVRENEAGFGELRLEISQQELEEGFREGYEYHAIYAGSQKVGTLRTERRKNGDGYRLRSEMDLRIDLLGTATQTYTEVDAFLDDGFRLERFEARASGGLLDLEIEGQWSGDRMVVTGLPGEAGARGFEMPEPPFILPSLRPVLMRSKLEVGDRVTFSYFDPLGQQEVTSDVTYLGREEIELMGTIVEAYHFKETALGHQTHVWVNALGEVLIEEMPMGFRAVREPEAEARYGLDAQAEVAARDRRRGPGVASVPVDASTTLDRGRWDVGRFTFVDLDTEVADDLSDERQRVVLGGEGVVVEVTRPTKLPNAAPLGDEELVPMRAMLGDSLALDAGDPSVVRALGDALGKGGSDALAPATVAETLTEWVRLEIELSADVGPSTAKETASDVLERRRGSVAGRAVALAALLRAAGIPSRVVHGAVAVRESDGGFDARGHTWCEVWLRSWVGLDPTLDMVPVDAGYLRIGYGEGDVQRLLTRGALSKLELAAIDGEEATR